MRKRLVAALLLGATLLPSLQGCFPVVAAGVGTGVAATLDRRTRPEALYAVRGNGLHARQPFAVPHRHHQQPLMRAKTRTAQRAQALVSDVLVRPAERS